MMQLDRKIEASLFEYTKALTIETLLWGFSVEGPPITGKKKPKPTWFGRIQV